MNHADDLLNYLKSANDKPFISAIAKITPGEGRKVAVELTHQASAG
ncbi:MAG: hypothetical protein HY343_12240 [Lentisphaerae bacterium]|nr:hypothetical protein [Lentisphaerota bacterium]